ncbi:hypothetical protein SSX86_026873 [Deinandra increscens subsp. villosa]|uniref:Uncharacterized protein n=1 Tax=Deinandra increscens subsp. villosa TaxID=3103831 RepID=A0AAP0CIX6_9ASTR
MSDQNAFEVESGNRYADSTFYDAITTSFERLDICIDNATSNKKSLASALDSVINLVKEVELKEKAAKEAKAEAATQDVREVLHQKAGLANKIKKLQCRVFGVLNEGDKCLGHFDEMRKELDSRLTSAMREKELADQEKLEKEILAQEALAFEESQMLRLTEESKRLKEEAVKISTLQDILQEHEFNVNILHGDVSDKYQDIKLLRECLDQPVLQLSGLLLSSQTSSILPSSSSLTTSLVPDHETPEETVDEPVPFVDEFSFRENELLNLAFEKQEGNMNGSSEVKIAPVVTDIIEVGHSMSTESFVASAQTFVECEAAPIIVTRRGKTKKKGHKKSVKKRSKNDLKIIEEKKG